jgi:hypothetical protein
MLVGLALFLRVGGRTQLNYNGNTLTVVPVAQPNETSSSLDTLSAISASYVWAVRGQIGSGTAIGGSTLIEHWNGAAWSIVPSPTPEWTVGVGSADQGLVLSHG